MDYDYNQDLICTTSVLDRRSKEWKRRHEAWAVDGGSYFGGRDKYLLLKGGKLDKMLGTSIFDPVLCEYYYNTFNVRHGSVLDPFCGGVARGLVASFMDMPYTGIDVRPEQIEDNEKFFKETYHTPLSVQYIANDAYKTVDELGMYDMLFSCPPYYDLEKYSDLEEDLSNMDAKQFERRLYDIYNKCCQHIRENRFAVIVVSDVRDKNGFLRSFPEFIIDSFRSFGFKLYNRAVVIGNGRSARWRSENTITTRKLVKAHEDVLVFYNGDIDSIKYDFV